MCISVGWWLFSSHTLLKHAREGRTEGLAEVGPHEGIHDRVDAGVEVGHAVSPDLQLVGAVVVREVWAEGPHQDVKLDGAPAQEEELHHHQNHA